MTHTTQRRSSGTALIRHDYPGQPPVMTKPHGAGGLQAESACSTRERTR
jgi:hypothetical protein